MTLFSPEISRTKTNRNKKRYQNMIENLPLKVTSLKLLHLSAHCYICRQCYICRRLLLHLSASAVITFVGSDCYICRQLLHLSGVCCYICWRCYICRGYYICRRYSCDNLYISFLCVQVYVSRMKSFRQFLEILFSLSQEVRNSSPFYCYLKTNSKIL